MGYEYSVLSEYEKYFGRLINKYKNKAQTMIRKAEFVIDKCTVFQILPNTFEDDSFPGYDKVNITWEELKRLIEKTVGRQPLKSKRNLLDN